MPVLRGVGMGASPTVEETRPRSFAVVVTRHHRLHRRYGKALQNLPKVDFS